MLYRNFIRWKQVQCFVLSRHLLLREGPFHIARCLSHFISNFSLSAHWSCWGVPFGTFAHNFYFVLKNIWLASELIKCGSRVVRKLFNKTMQKISVKLSNGDPTASLKKRGSEAIASSAFLNTNPWLQPHHQFAVQCHIVYQSNHIISPEARHLSWAGIAEAMIRIWMETSSSVWCVS